MRSSLSVALLSLTPSLVAATTTPPQCLQAKAHAIALAALCGDKATLKQCLAKAPEHAEEDFIQKCLVKAGCTPKAAVIEASYLISHCDGEPGELRRRRADAMPAERDDASDSATTTTTATTTGVTKRSTAESTAAATTAVTQRDTTTAATTAAATTSLQCSTESTLQVTSCDSVNKYDCSEVTTTTSVCAAGLFCDTDAAGNNLCMERQDGLTTSGAVVAIFLAVFLAAMVSAIIFLCCKDRREQKRVRARAEAAAIAKANAISRPETTQARSVSAARAPSAGGNPFAG
ncbi:hypothetical protein BJ170DRAFT_432776 [Xylariales sp. AK1849]|nr:hypothetical protein BJ170DRAFT_432776 [Xylariales sp. AK1849]